MVTRLAERPRADAVVRTPRLVLRPFTAEDRADIVALHSDPRVTALLIDSIPARPRMADIYLLWAESLYTSGEPGPYHASLASDGTFAGSFSLVRDQETGLLELGGRLFPKYWGTGLALEGGQALVNAAFGARGEAALVSLGHPENRAINFVLARLGFLPQRLRNAFDTRAVEWRQERAEWERRGGGPLPRREAARITTKRAEIRDDP